MTPLPCIGSKDRFSRRSKIAARVLAQRSAYREYLSRIKGYRTKRLGSLCSERGSPLEAVAFFYEQCSEKPCAVDHCSRAKRRTVDSLRPSTSAVVFTNETIGSGKRACSTEFIGPLCLLYLANIWIDIFRVTEESVTQIIDSAEKVSMLVVSTVLYYFASLKISITASLW